MHFHYCTILDFPVPEIVLIVVTFCGFSLRVWGVLDEIFRVFVMFRQLTFYTRGGATSRWHFAGDRWVGIMKKMENHCFGSTFRRVFARRKWNRKTFLLHTQSKQLTHIVHTWGRGQKMCFWTSTGRFEKRNYGEDFQKGDWLRIMELCIVWNILKNDLDSLSADQRSYALFVGCA